MKGQKLHTIQSARHRLPVLLAVLAAGALLGACGSSSSASSTSSSSSSSTSTAAAGAGGPNAARRTALRKCLAQHGVTLPSRPAGSRPPGSGQGAPGAGGGLFGGGGGAGANRFANNPKLAAAFRACGGANFGGGARRFQLSHTAITNFVACVRKHGYPSMPSPNFSGKGPVLPASIRTNKQFLSASKSCASLLVRPRANGAPPGGGSGA